ncbi:MAG: cobyrinic acid a,c-diamide synthase, partial [Pseudomonadota bacterium]
RNSDITQPSRHLGLVQAEEHPDLEAFLDMAAGLVMQSVDLDAMLDLAGGHISQSLPLGDCSKITPPAQKIGIAKDAGFAFAYPHILADWRDQGADIVFFSPLAGDPVPECEFVFLPGGYPELHAGRLAANDRFLTSLRTHASTKPVYGECGGYMVLGEGLIDAQGNGHRMAGLLKLETSFARRKLHLGYRSLTAPDGPFPGRWAAHEFHYASTLRAEGTPLFAARDAEGTDLGAMGLRHGLVSGSFAHLIDASP